MAKVERDLNPLTEIGCRKKKGQILPFAFMKFQIGIESEFP